MKTPKNRSITPRNQWRFTDPLTGIPFKNSDLNTLLRNVRKSRVSNGLEVESGWDNLVEHQMCEQNPHYDCDDVDKPEVRLTGDDIFRFLTTVKEMAGHDLVSDEEHIRRANKCLSCPKMAPVSCTFPCGWVSSTVTELLGGRKIHRVTELHKMGCKSCGCNLDAKTYYPLDVLKAVDQKLGKEPDYWEQCWMREWVE